MLWSRLFIVVLACVLSEFGFAHSLDQKNWELNACEQMLGLTLKSGRPGEPVQFDLSAGMSMRGFLGSYPEVSSEREVELASDGVYYWGQSFAVRRSLEEAHAHDVNFKGLDKVMYLISDVDVSDLHDETPREILRDRFKNVFAHAEVVYWDDSESILKDDVSIPARLVRMDQEVVRRLISPEKLGYYTKDDRGPRFLMSGWVFPVIRGQLTYQAVFKANSDTIKKVLRRARRQANEGYRYTYNENFQEALNMARDQVRIVENPETGKLETVTGGSRYMDAEIYKKALDGFHAGHVFSVEVRDPSGRLVAGILGERASGNLFKFDTIFYEVDVSPDGKIRTRLDDAKIAVLAGMDRLHDHGIDMVDAGMVTVFTASMKGRYVSSASFIESVEDLQKLPIVSLDLSRPWTPPPSPGGNH